MGHFSTNTGDHAGLQKNSKQQKLNMAEGDTENQQHCTAKP